MTVSLQAIRVDKLVETLTRTAREHGPAAFSSSLSAEDMVITDVILTAGLDIEIFTIDTGRLHERNAGARSTAFGEDTDTTFESTRRRPLRLRRMSDSTDAMRSTGRSSSGASAAICARSSRSSARSPANAPGSPACARWPERESILRGFSSTRLYGVIKFNPLAQWSEAAVWDYLREHDVPFNRLYDHGYRSIGCAPCTRPTLPNEDVRAGRWWWEQGATKECGLHLGRAGPTRPRAGRSHEYGRVTLKSSGPRGPHGSTSTGSSPRPYTSCAKSPPNARTRCCSSPAARIPPCCCGWPKRHFARAASRFRCCMSIPAITFPR